MISISEPLVDDLEERLVIEVLRSGRLVKGPMVARFEAAVREIVGTRHAIAVNNGTSALIASLIAHDIGPGDEVVTTPFTFVATLNAILHVGATPRFVDIGDDFNLDPGLLDAAITPATRAVLPVHLFGLPADMSEIVDVVGDEVLVIEDAAQALGAQVAQRQAGSFGTGCFSFYGTKNFTTGEGGVVTTDDDGLADEIRLLSDQGQRSRYDYARPGFNLRMSELHAAVGVAQLTRLGEVETARRKNAQLLSAGLTDLEGIVLPHEPIGRKHVFHQFTIRVTSDAPVTRDELHERLHGHGVGSAVYYPGPVFDHACFYADERVGRPQTPEARRAAREVLSLPVHPKLDESDVCCIIDTVRMIAT